MLHIALIATLTVRRVHVPQHRLQGALKPQPCFPQRPTSTAAGYTPADGVCLTSCTRMPQMWPQRFDRESASNCHQPRELAQRTRSATFPSSPRKSWQTSVPQLRQKLRTSCGRCDLRGSQSSLTARHLRMPHSSRFCHSSKHEYTTVQRVRAGQISKRASLMLGRQAYT